MAYGRPNYRKVCLVHGKSTKPHECQSTSYEQLHPEARKDKKCQKCGECCHVSIRVDPHSKQGKAMVQKIQRRGRILREVGVDPEKVVEYIGRRGQIPLRRYVGAGHLQWDNFIYDTACALLVPEEALAKGKIRKRLSDVPMK